MNHLTLVVIFVVAIAAAFYAGTLTNRSVSVPPLAPQLPGNKPHDPAERPDATQASTNPTPSKANTPPAYVPPAVTTPGLSNVVDKTLPIDVRVHDLASGALPEVKNQQDQETLAKRLSDPKEDEVVRHEIANLLLRSNYTDLEPLLFKIIDNPDEGPKFRAWAVQHAGGLLYRKSDTPVSDKLTERVRGLLNHPELYVRREALLALSRANDPKGLQVVRDLLKDQSAEKDDMRDLAMRIAQENNMRDMIPDIRTHLSSTNEIVRIAAMHALSQLRDEESRPAIEAAMKQGSPRVQRAAAAALEHYAAAPKVPAAATPGKL